MWPVIWNSLATRHEPHWPVPSNLKSKILCFLDHRESDLIWLHTSFADVLFSLDQWLYQSIGILTDCLSTVEFSQNKYPLATSFIESPACVCSTNRPHWDGNTVFRSASKQCISQENKHIYKNVLKMSRVWNLQSKWAAESQSLSAFH